MSEEELRRMLMTAPPMFASLTASFTVPKMLIGMPSIRAVGKPSTLRSLTESTLKNISVFPFFGWESVSSATSFTTVLGAVFSAFIVNDCSPERIPLSSPERVATSNGPEPAPSPGKETTPASFSSNTFMLRSAML